ncbi:MAG: FAD-binding protein, partial [Planctomycetota bacterium]
GEGGRVWVPRQAQDVRSPRDIPEPDRYYFLEERYPEYGNLVPRDIATREIFNICVNEGLSVEDDRMSVYLDLTHIARSELDRKLGGILEIYEKFQGVDPRDEPMKIFPAVHYSMGGLWADYVRTADGGLEAGAPRNHMTSIEGLYAIGECDYHYHGANRLGANSLLSCIFTGLFTGSSIVNYAGSQAEGAEDVSSELMASAVKQQEDRHQHLLNGNSGSQENPYLIHQELGDLMTRVATVVRHNDQLTEAISKVDDLHERARRVSLSDTGAWTNQNVIFSKALQDMFPIAKSLLKGALQRDECRGAHYKPDFEKPSLSATDPGERRRQAEEWCDAFQANNDKYLKSTVASWNDDAGQPDLTYEEVDTSIIPPRPRLYGLVGAEEIERVWKERSDAKAQTKPELASV